MEAGNYWRVLALIAAAFNLFCGFV